MKTWRVRFLLNGMPTETIVRAISDGDARRMVIAQYPTSRVAITSCVTI